METKDYLRYLARVIHRTIIATVDDEGLPVTAAIDMMGASVLVSRFFGMKDMKSLKKAVCIMLHLCISFGLVFTFLTIFFRAQIMRIYTPDEEIIKQGVNYFTWSIPTYLLLGLTLDCTLVLRSIGKAKIPLLTSIVSFFCGYLRGIWFLGTDPRNDIRQE